MLRGYVHAFYKKMVKVTFCDVKRIAYLLDIFNRIEVFIYVIDGFIDKCLLAFVFFVCGYLGERRRKS